MKRIVSVFLVLLLSAPLVQAQQHNSVQTPIAEALQDTILSGKDTVIVSQMQDEADEVDSEELIANSIDNISNQFFNSHFFKMLLWIPIAIFIAIALLLLLLFYDRHRRYRLAERAIENGIPIPQTLPKAHVMKSEPLNELPYQQMFNRGIKQACVGIGLAISFYMITGSIEMASIGIFILFIGIGKVVVGILNTNADSRLEMMQRKRPHRNDKTQQATPSSSDTHADDKEMNQTDQPL